MERQIQSLEALNRLLDFYFTLGGVAIAFTILIPVTIFGMWWYLAWRVVKVIEHRWGRGERPQTGHTVPEIVPRTAVDSDVRYRPR